MMSSLERFGRERISSRPVTVVLITVSALMASGILDTSLLHHIERAKANGVTATEMSEALTQLAFYAGWPKAWAALRMAKNVYGKE